MDFTELKVEINIPDYKEIASKIKRNKVSSATDEEVKTALSRLQQSRAKFSQIQRPAQKGDFVEIEYSYSAGRAPNKDRFILGQAGFMPGFEDNLQGLSSGEEKEFSLKKQGSSDETAFKVKMISVQKMELPEIDDDLAKGLGKFNDLNDLREKLNQGISKEKEMVESQRIRQEILEKIVKSAHFDIPEQLIEAEKARMLRALKQEISKGLKISFEDYLKKVGKKQEEIIEGLGSEAEKRIQNSLVLGEIAKKENIEVREDEAIQSINDILKTYPDAETAKKKLDINNLKVYIKEVICNDKVLSKLESFAG